MSDPYRAPGSPEGENGSGTPSPKSPKRSDEELGGLRSSHVRPRAVTSVIGGWVEVDVYDHGLVFHAAYFGRRVLFFEEIDAVHYDFGLLHYRNRTPRVDLVTFEGERVSIPSLLEDLEVVLDAVDRKVTRPITEQAKDALAHGERLVFGPLILQLDGIVLKEQSLSWSDLEWVDAERDAIVFYARGPRSRFGWVRVADIPHPKALLEVLRMRTDVVMSGLRL